MSSHNLYGAPASVRAPIIWALTNAGFPREDAETWASAWLFLPEPGLVLAEAESFDNHGIPVDAAIEWHNEGFFAAEASCFYDARYTPAQAATVRNLSVYEEEADEWVASGLPADRVIAYLRAEVDLDEVPEFEAASNGPDGPLSMLAALLLG